MKQEKTNLSSEPIMWADGTKCWYKKDTTLLLHRLDGPAAIDTDGGRECWENGKQHRLDGPAVIYPDGGREWWVNGELHRLDGPAKELADGSKEWWENGERHRLNGPAKEFADGTQEWWVNGDYLEGSVLDLFKQAIDKTTQPGKLDRLSHHENHMIAEAAARNQNCPIEAQVEWTLTRGAGE